MRRVFVGLLVCALGLGASAASAQTERELAAARDDFRRGVRLTQRGRWDAAVARFRRVLEVRATSAVKYNLALALSHTDATLEAAELLDEVLADPELDEETRAQATTVMGELEPRLGRLTVAVSGADAGATVLLDDEAIAAERVGRRVWVQPGEHTVALQRGPADVVTRRVTVEAGAAEEVAFAPPALPEVALAADEPILAEEGGGGGGGDLTSEWWFWTIVAGGALAIGAGIVIGVVVSEDGAAQPILGDLEPGLLRVQ